MRLTKRMSKPGRRRPGARGRRGLGAGSMLIASVGRRERRGMSLLYLMAAMVLLFAIVSLAVDYGRVQLAKAQLQQAADGAARYAITGINDGTAVAKAIEEAGQNTADGSAVRISADDVVLGNWDLSVAPHFSPTRTPINAVQVTASRTAAKGDAVPLLFASAFGIPGCNVTARSIASTAPAVAGFVGLKGVDVKNNAVIASYDSSTSINPTPANAHGNGSIGSNGLIDGDNNNELRGTAMLGPDGQISGFDVYGTTRRLLDPISTPSLPDWTPSPNPGGAARNYTVKSATTLPGGTYWFTSLTIKAPLSFSGPATLIVNGDIALDSSLAAASKVPADLIVYQLGSDRSFGDDKNNMDITAIIVAPGSDFLAKNNFVARGSLFFGTITVKNNFEMYYDEALARRSTGDGLGDIGRTVVVTVQ